MIESMSKHVTHTQRLVDAADPDGHPDKHVVHTQRLVDGADPDTWPSAEHATTARCLVCSSAEPARLVRLNLDTLDLARAGLHGAHPVVCLRDLEAAMRRVGAPRPSGNQPTCVACNGDDPARFGVTAVWPPESGYHASKPTIRACRRHLAEAVAALAQETAR